MKKWKKPDFKINWFEFARGALSDLKLYLLLMVAYSIGRVSFIIYFSDRMSEGSAFANVMMALLNGLRFDSMAAGAVVVLSFFFWSVPNGLFDLTKINERVRLVYGTLAMFLAIGGYRVLIGFYKEYDDVFNYWILGVIYDDLGAIFKTAGSENNVFLTLLVMAALITLSFFALKLFLRKQIIPQDKIDSWANTRKRKIALTTCFVLLLAILVRGSLGSRPMQLRDAAITSDRLLNKAVQNPFTALNQAVKQYRRISSTAGIESFMSIESLPEATQIISGKICNTVDEATKRLANGAKSKKPKHICLMVMESFDSWSLLDKYAELNTANRFKKLGAEGLYTINFLPASTGTMTSLSAILTGLADVSVITNYRMSANKPFPTSIAPIMKRLGYKTRIFYSGYLSWQRIGDFCREQGFDEVIGGADIGGYAGSNEWGFNDDVFFDHAKEIIKNGPPSFNLMLTTTNHPPYDIDIHALGYDVKEIPPHLPNNGEGNIMTIGHMWFSDRELDRFVRSADTFGGETLFAITGDHHSRRHIDAKPSLFERNAVPLVLWSNGDILNGLKFAPNTTGSHLDILPTIIELIAEKDFEYHTIGRSLLGATPPTVAAGAGAYISGDYIYAPPPHTAKELLPWVKQPGEESQELGEQYIAEQYYRATHALSWWRIMRGNELRSNALRNNNLPTNKPHQPEE